MKRVWKIMRWLVVVVLCLFIAAQFSRPARTNPTLDQSLALQSHVQVSPQVASIIDRSCGDCHSNKTRWPWYSNVAPVSWLVIDHVNHGRSHLNFSEWGRYNQREAQEMLSQICKEVKSGAMPLSSYTPLHPGSKLSVEDVKVLCDWTNAERGRIAAMNNESVSEPGAVATVLTQPFQIGQLAGWEGGQAERAPAPA